MKILHLPTSVGGNSYGLSQAEKGRGYLSECLYNEGSWLNYPADINLGIESKSKINKLYTLYKTFRKVRKEYDVFHFNFGTSLINFNKPFLRLFDLPRYPEDKKLIMTYNGCDARQKYITMEDREVSSCHFEHCYNGMCNSGKLDQIRRENIETSAKYVDHIFYLNPDLGRFLPKEKSSFLPYTIAGWNRITQRKIKKPSNRILKVLHAPTDRGLKGSHFLLDAIEKINEKEKRIELILVENIPYEEALELYKTADLVVDQLLIGWYGAFAVEVMKSGVPVACFISSKDAGYLPNGMFVDLEDAIINMNPFAVESTLLAIIEDRSVLSKKADAALSYIHKWHEPDFVVGQSLEYYEK